MSCRCKRQAVHKQGVHRERTLFINDIQRIWIKKKKRIKIPLTGLNKTRCYVRNLALFLSLFHSQPHFIALFVRKWSPSLCLESDFSRILEHCSKCYIFTLTTRWTLAQKRTCARTKRKTQNTARAFCFLLRCSQLFFPEALAAALVDCRADLPLFL